MPAFQRLLFRRHLVFLVACAAAPEVFAEEQPGKRIYQMQCARCHGVKGEGTKKEYPDKLVGNRSLTSLTRYIERRMPDEAPEKCVGDEARKVAKYIYDAFYSKAAQMRNKPPRIDLSRLTVPQYRNAVADLIGSVRQPGIWNTRRGLQAQFFKTRRLRRRLAGQIDPVVNFDFGKKSPKAGLVDAKSFAIRWNGSVLAPESGEFEFIVETENAFKLWVNDRNKPLIDAWVKSGKDKAFRKSIQLLGGRVYPLQLEFYKSDKEATASVSLRWKRPHRTATLIVSEFLTPNRFPESFVAETKFPPDDRSEGYERGTSVSKAWVDATTDGAIETANYVTAHLSELAGLRAVGKDQREAKLREFSARFMQRAFRRPLTKKQKDLVDRSFGKAPSPEAATKRVVLLALTSPRFLYRELGAKDDPNNVASRMSFSLWDSLPDKELMEAVAAGELSNRKQITQHAQRMLSDLRARTKLRQYLTYWLHVDQPLDLAKDPKKFPQFTPEIASDLRSSLELFLDDVVWSDGSDFRQLLLADHTYLNERLAKFYDVAIAKGDGFRKVRFKDGKSAGALTHPYLMASFAYTDTTSPIHRGVFLARNVLGRRLRPPPDAFTPLSPDLHPNLTTRERVTLQTKSKFCMS